jgi:acetylcholinesterase
MHSYRVNILGFPNARALKQDEQNLGLLDQRLGVEWVQQNIEAFGGDISRITLWGQSAGSMSVDLYNFAYPEDPIVSGLIMDSGTTYLPLENWDTTHSNFSFVATNVGCGNTDADDELACMRTVNSTVLEAFLKGYSDNGTSPSIGFEPVVDNRTRFDNYTELALAGNYSRMVFPLSSRN